MEHKTTQLAGSDRFEPSILRTMSIISPTDAFSFWRSRGSQESSDCWKSRDPAMCFQCSDLLIFFVLIVLPKFSFVSAIACLFITYSIVYAKLTLAVERSSNKL